MKKKNLIAVLLILVYAFGLFGCSNNEIRVWEWAQSLTQEDIVSAIPWHCGTEHTESEPLNDEEIRELAALLNGLTKKNFTENKHLVGITATVGINLETDSETYHINYAPSPYGKYGMLEMKYGEKQWWIDDTALLAFFERVTDSRPTEAIREDELYVSPEDLDVFYDLESFLDYAATAPSGGIADLASLEYFYLPTGIPEEYRLYKITAAKNDIGFWYLPEEALASDDARLSAESRNEHFLFISPRVNYSGFAGDETTLTWQENGDLLMLYLPKDFTVDDREAFCQTEKFCRNSEDRFLVAEKYDADIEVPNYFAFDESLKVSYHDYHCVEETGEWEKEVTEISLAEEETQILLDLLQPYTDTIIGDVLKCDYFCYYSIEIDDRMTLTIDPELGNYGENGESYMLVMEHYPGAYIKGTYIDAELVNYLAECLEQTNGV